MKDYIGVKVVAAEPMSRGEYNEYRGWKIPSNENPEDEGYHIRYPDGYESWCPKKQFDEAYRKCNNMTFGIAIEAMKKGKKVARRGWNGKGMYIYMSEGQNIDINDKTVKFNPHIDMKAADDSIVIGWLASQTDILAEDWMIVE